MCRSLKLASDGRTKGLPYGEAGKFFCGTKIIVLHLLHFPFLCYNEFKQAGDKSPLFGADDLCPNHVLPWKIHVPVSHFSLCLHLSFCGIYPVADERMFGEFYKEIQPARKIKVPRKDLLK